MQPHGSEIAELKYATTIDRLMESGRIASLHHIQFDVDSNGYRILQGMARLLGYSATPLTIQVELNEPHTEEILAFLQARQYTLIGKHHTRSAARRMEQTGENPAEGCNAIFRRAA